MNDRVRECPSLLPGHLICSLFFCLTSLSLSSLFYLYQDRGAWCGLTKDEIGEDNMRRFDACDESITPAEGESYPALKQRVLEALDECLDRMKPGEQGCLVSHLQVTRSILSQALDVPTNEMSNLKVATASITCIDYDENKKATVHFQSFKPEVGLAAANDGAN